MIAGFFSVVSILFLALGLSVQSDSKGLVRFGFIFFGLLGLWFWN